MYGCSITDNMIVATGNVITKSITQSNVIVGENPAKIISMWSKFLPILGSVNNISKVDLIAQHEKNTKLVTR